MAHDFDFTTEEYEYTEKRVKGPDGKEYTLRTMLGKDATTWKNKRTEALRMSKGDVTGFKGLANLDPLAIHFCLYSGDKQVPVSVIEQWHPKIIETLAEAAKDMSGLSSSEDPIRGHLEKALTNPDAPCTIQDIREFVKSFNDEDEFSTLLEWLEPSEEELAKNEQES